MRKSEKRKKMKGERNRRSLRITAFILTAVMLLSTTAFAAEGNAAAGGESFAITEADPSAVPQDSLYLENAPTIPEEKEPYSDDEDVRILIKLKEDGALSAGYSAEGIAENIRAEEYMDGLKGVQDEIAESISDDVVTDGSFEYLRSYAMITNALEANAKYGDLEAIDAYLRENYGDIFEEIYTVPQMDIESATGGEYDTETYSASTMVGAPNAWKSGYSGAGTLVAVIDTGLDIDHPSFDENAFLYSLKELKVETGTDYEEKLLTEDKLETTLPQLHAYEDYKKKDSHLTVDNFYRNAKVPFGYNYVDDNLNIGHDQDEQGDHGTHVSGIAAANKYVKSEDSVGGVHYVRQENNVCGIAPDAQLVVMKVFGEGGGAYSTDTLPAIEDAIHLGCNSINLSLGSPIPGKSYATDKDVVRIFNEMVEADSLVVFSSGNSGHWPEHNVANSLGLDYAEDISMHMGGTSGSYTNSFTVASDTNTTLTGIGGDFNGYFALVTDGSNASNPEWRTLDTSEDGSGTDYEYVFLGDPKNPDDTVKYGDVGSYDDAFQKFVKGKIVLVSRGGSVNFSVKHMEAEKAEAAGCLVYNNVNEAISMTLEGSTAKIPCASITLRDMEGILENSKLENGYYTGTMHIADEVKSVENDEGYEMSSFSSWGTTGNLAIKPDITAPGGNIYSSVNDGNYSVMSGTSMSAPSITGQSALVAQYVKESGLENTDVFTTRRALVTSLLMGTAKPLLDPACGVPYSVRQQGAGLANVDAAVSTPAYIEMSPESVLYPETAHDGRVKAELKDDPDRTGVYTFTFTIHNTKDKELTYVLDPYIITPEIIEQDGEKYMSTHSMLLNSDVTFTVNGQELNSRVYDLNQDGVVDTLDAKIVNRFVAGLGTLTEEQQSMADLNSDGAVTSVDVYLLLKYISEGASRLDAAELTVPASGDVTVTVSIKLSESDRALFAANNPNGAYVEGYIEMHGEVDLSVPFLTFYGNFTEPSMYDRTTYTDFRYGLSDKKSYVSETGNVNFLSVKPEGSNIVYLLGSNLYAEESTFIPDRNMVFSTESTPLYSVNPTFIRTVDSVHVVVTDASTGEQLWDTYTSGSEAYYNSDAWANTYNMIRLSEDLYGTDVPDWQQKLEDGDKIKVAVTAAPELYTKDGEGGKVIEESKIADGAVWETVLTVDNEAPKLLNADNISGSYRKDKDGIGHFEVKVQDNRYVAAVFLSKTFNNNKNKESMRVLLRKAVNQEEPGVETTVDLELGKNIKGTDFQIMVIDYAGNLSAYDVHREGTGDGDDEVWNENSFFGFHTTDGKTTWDKVNMTDATTEYASDVNMNIMMDDWSIGAYADGRVYAFGTVSRSDPQFGTNMGGKSYLFEMYSDDLVPSSSQAYHWNKYSFTDMTYSPSFQSFILSAVSDSDPAIGLLAPGSNAFSEFNIKSNTFDGQKVTGITYLYTTNETDESETVTYDWFLMVTDGGNFYISRIHLEDTLYTMESVKVGSCDTIKIENDSDYEKSSSSTLVCDHTNGDLYYLLDGTLYKVNMTPKAGVSGNENSMDITATQVGSNTDLLGNSSVLLQLNDQEREPNDTEKNAPWLKEENSAGSVTEVKLTEEYIPADVVISGKNQ